MDGDWRGAGAFARTRANTHSCRMKPRHGWGTRRSCADGERWIGGVHSISVGGRAGATAGLSTGEGNLNRLRNQHTVTAVSRLSVRRNVSRNDSLSFIRASLQDALS